MKILLLTLCVGLIIGFVAQRSRFCLIGGIRDYMIVRDKYLLKGFVSLLLAAVALFALFSATGKYKDVMPNYPQFMQSETSTDLSYSTCQCTNSARFVTKAPDGTLTVDLTALKPDALVYFTIGGAFLIGLLSVLIGGCPLRQHVKAAGGNKSAMMYVAGFYIGVVIYMLFISGPITDFFSA